MTASFRKIDYSLRPSKHAERRMLAELFRRLRPFQPVDDYGYVGFGSVWFSDFALFHRLLGISDMLSIERQADAKARIDANKPFGCIGIDYRSSEVALPEVDWSKRKIVWLDYDDPLAAGMLLDVRTVATRAKSGTVLAVSIQCQKAAEVYEAEADHGGATAFERFRGRFGPEKLRPGASELDLYGWRYGRLIRAMLSDEIDAALGVRNAADSMAPAFGFRPICSFEYEDGAKMTTLVGIIVRADELFLFEACKFGTVDFVGALGATVSIPFPKITPREARLIEQSLPWPEGPAPVIGAVPPSDARDFAAFYRYWPNYAVLEG